MGPLNGFKIVEIAGLGPTQFTGMLLADMGAQVIRVARAGPGDPGVQIPPRFNLMNRSRPTISVDLKDPDGVRLVLRLCETADALFEGFRPGVMERLGLGPGECRAVNRRLVYGRMTGWGQAGPLANAAGHDANYIALAGALASIGEAGGAPVLPLNLVGDFGGGALYLAMGLLAALLEASRSGEGQVVDAAIVDGTASMMTVFHGLLAAGLWREQRGVNLLDGGAPFARAYRTLDDRWVVVSPLERPFFAELLERLGLNRGAADQQLDAAGWPALESQLRQVFSTRTRAQWCELLEGTDACFAPVLTPSESAQHPHNVYRETYLDVDGVAQPAPAPRFSRTHSSIGSPAGPALADPSSPLRAWGLSEDDIQDLLASAALPT
jgi:alpha-methylacyl-CoA racemase